MGGAKLRRTFLLVVTVILLRGRAAFAVDSVKLQKCIILVAHEQNVKLRVAATVLSEEVEHRTGLDWQITANDFSEQCTIELAIATDQSASQVVHREQKEPNKPESFAISSPAGERVRIQVQGFDARGVLFGVGYLLRQFSMQTGSVLLPRGAASLATVQYPAFAIRGHQLGYRPKNNTFDGWSPEQFDQYIRDLAVFGTNTIELIPPRSDDAATSPLYTLPPLAMMRMLSETIDHYGLNCSIWYPALDKDYSNPRTVELAVEEWGAVFRALPRIDAIFVPGGDPGHTQPKYLFALLEREAEELHKTHPKAQVWVSPQSFSAAWLVEFYALLSLHPAWLTGVVYGPEMRETPEQFREHVPAAYPIRFYPDITHTAAAQYPVPEWDPAFALTEGREPVDPRPADESIIFHRYAPLTAGFVAYSEGSNDDINKILWSAWSWDPLRSAAEILEEYGRYFISPSVSQSFARGVKGLEQNWRGPIVDNASIPRTLRLFEDLARHTETHPKGNWRLQQLLYRANYDAYIQQRSRHENVQEKLVISTLQRLADNNPAQALRLSGMILAQEPGCKDSHLCRRASALAQDLFRTIRMQLSVQRYQALAVDRGANLDTIDAPLGDLSWLRKRLSEAVVASRATEQSRRIGSILAVLDVPAHRLRDSLGIAGERPHLLYDSHFWRDPSGLLTIYNAVEPYSSAVSEPLNYRTYAGTLYDLPLRMNYSQLTPHRGYLLHVRYATSGTEMSLRANGVPLSQQCLPPGNCLNSEVEISSDVNQNGNLLLEWTAPPGLGGNGRRLKISQVELEAKH